MEKFAVDLDKVLDELEFNEDRAENMITSGNRCHLASVSPSPSQDNGAVPLHNSPHVQFESGDHGMKWKPKPAPVSQKTSVSGVFSSLNEYLNSGRAKAPPSGSTTEVADKSFQCEDVPSQPLAWSPVQSNNVSTMEEMPILIDSSTLHPSSSTSAVENESPDCSDFQTTVETLLPDIANTGSSIVFKDRSEFDLLSHKSLMSAVGNVNTAGVNSIVTSEMIIKKSLDASSVNLSGEHCIHSYDKAYTDSDSSDLDSISTSNMTSIPVSDVTNVDVEVDNNQTVILNVEPSSQNAILSFGSTDVADVLNDDELNDYLSDLELEEEEQEHQSQLSHGPAPSCEPENIKQCDTSIESESHNGSQTDVQTSEINEAMLKNNAEVSSCSVVEVLQTECLPDELSIQNSAHVISPSTSIATAAESKQLYTVSQNFLGTSSNSIEVITTSKNCSEITAKTGNPLPSQDGELSSAADTLVLESEENVSSSESPSQLSDDSVVDSSEELATSLQRKILIQKSESSAEELVEQHKELVSNLPATVKNNGFTNLEGGTLATSKVGPQLNTTYVDQPSVLPEPQIDLVLSKHLCDNSPEEENGLKTVVNITPEISTPTADLMKSVALSLSLEETFSAASNRSSPPTPPTVPVTPTLDNPPVLEDCTSTLSTASTPFMTPTAVFSESQAFFEESARDGTPETAAAAETAAAEFDSSASSGLCQRPVRPSSLEIPVRTEPAMVETGGSSEDSPVAFNSAVGPPGATPCANRPSMSESLAEAQGTDESGAESSIDEAQFGAVGGAEAPPTNSMDELLLGKEPPFWVPDADAPCCMLCDFKFTVLKRRHHCRACGKVLCSKCCNEKAHLAYINAEARVCVSCKSVLLKVEAASPASPQRTNPNPNNPMEYCSTVPPLLQVAGSSQSTPTVMVPVGVLKREGSSKPKSEAKQVMFSDGIRPGADLAELDGSSEPRLSIRRIGRTAKRVGTPPGNTSTSQKTLPQLDTTTLSYVPHGKGLPPVVIKGKDGVQFEEDPDPSRLMTVIRDESAPPVKFTINRNLYVMVKILNLDCCVNRICWCFTSDGLSSVGQDEIIIILEMDIEESSVPKDIFIHLNTLYMEAAKGNTVTEMGHTLTQGSLFLGSKDHGGFLYVRPTFQCLHRLILPPAPYLVGVLIHKWETPWARVFPIRLMLRLGAEFRYYPCPLVSIRQRSAVYGEIGHTIISVLADFRNMTYTLPTVRGLVIHMEDKQTTILMPRNRYDQVMRALNNSNDHVLAFGANFSQVADSHLVCMQSDTDHSYHTQAINIHNKPRKVTGASFVVFNGALKASCGMGAKSSIVEDGLMVKVTNETMASLKTALRDMKDLSITCGPINPSGESSNTGAGISPNDEVVLIKWAEDDRSFNIGVLSSVDGRPLDGVPSIRVHNGTDYHGEYRFIRWTEVFILESEEGSGRTGDPVDISRLSEQLAKATCLALVKLLDLLAAANLITLAVRATIHPENVGYQAGSNGEKLPPIYMNSLDDQLVPVLHEAGLMSGESPAVLELVFRIMESG